MEELIESWQINNRLNLYLLNEIPGEHIMVKLEKGKTVSGNFVHLHNVRLMWVKSALPELLSDLTKMGDATPIEEYADHLKDSADAIASILRYAETPGGRVKGFKPHAAGFLSYMVAHESFHRACIELALRQNGMPLSDKVAYGIWEWGVR